MTDLMKTNGRFIGREQKNDKLWTYSFGIDGKRQFFGVWLPWTKKDGSVKKGKLPDELVAETMYSLSYSEKYTEGYEKPLKNLVCVFSTKKDTTLDTNSPPIKSECTLTINQVRKAWQQYCDKVPEKERDVELFIVSLETALNK